MMDSLGGSDGSVSAAAQCWLIRALSLNDVIRVLEPILLLLLHPNTQRCSIQNVKQNLTAGQYQPRGEGGRETAQKRKILNNHQTSPHSLRVSTVGYVVFHEPVVER